MNNSSMNSICYESIIQETLLFNNGKTGWIPFEQF